MGFRIRRDYDDDKLYEASMRAYREYLDKLCQMKVVAGDLRKYFYWDFFHDGKIEQIVFRNGTAEVQMTIICPNIKRKTKDGEFEYINVAFLCIFKDVAYYKFERTVEEEEGEHYGDPGEFTYICSEIDTLPELAPFQSKNDDLIRNNSLIIEVLPAYAHCSSCIEMVFREVAVEAVDNVSFQHMLASSDFEVPIYLEQENP